MRLKIMRVYESPERKNEFRVLVDKLWPRGVSKSKLNPDLWVKELAPSDTLRKWYHGHPDEWNGFRTKYFAELDEKGNEVNEFIARIKKEGEVFFLFSSKNESNNNASVLKEYIEKLSGQ